MRAGWLALLVGVACAAPGATRPPPLEPAGPTGPGSDGASHGVLADEDTYQPTYGKPELQKARIAEHAAEAALEHQLAELEARQPDAAVDDQVRIATADLAVRRRFLVTLEACEAAGRWCPPRLDEPPWAFELDAAADPPMTAALRFDLDGWRGLAAELHGRACACRTLACVDSVGVAIDQLEPRPSPEVRGDDAATTSVTRARECLFRLRGKAAMRLAAPADAADIE